MKKARFIVISDCHGDCPLIGFKISKGKYIGIYLHNRGNGFYVADVHVVSKVKGTSSRDNDKIPQDKNCFYIHYGDFKELNFANTKCLISMLLLSRMDYKQQLYSIMKKAKVRRID